MQLVCPHCRSVLLVPLARSLSAFEIRAKLYAGHISSVYRAVDKKSGITVGLKLYKRTMLNDMERHQIAREIWLHIQLNHPSIIALYAAWKDQDYIYLVLEWAPEVNWAGGDSTTTVGCRADTLLWPIRQTIYS